MKKIFLIIVILFSLQTVNALEKCTPSDEYLKYMEMSDEEKEKVQEPFYCKELMNNSDDDDARFEMLNALRTLLYGTTTDSKYNAMEDGIVTDIKNQLSLGTCWAFSATAAVESNALKNGLQTYDFSEAHMIYSLVSGGYSDEQGKEGKYITTNLDGGKINYAATYYLGGYGQLFENDMPYPTYQKKITKNDYIEGNKIITISDIEYNNINSFSKCSNNELETIKQLIIKNGAIQGSMYMDESLFKDTSKDYYISTLNNSSTVNHAITIIGWDDTIPKSYFKNATRNGALIVKNSWGKTWSKDGIFYVSYDDYFICKNIVSYGGTSNEVYDNYYTSSDVVGLPEFLFSNTFYMSTKITKIGNGKEELEKVSFPVGQNMTYNIYLSTDNVMNDKTNWIKLGSGTSNTLGFKSINVNSIGIEDDFTIIVEYIVDDEKTSSVFTMCTNEEDTANMQISSNTNFFSNTGLHWYDLKNINVGTDIISCEPNLYAYTNNFNYTLEVGSLNTNNNIVTIELNKSNITNNNLITYEIYDEDNNNKTDKFIIEKNYNTNKINVYTNDLLYGDYTIKIYYKSITVEEEFTLQETFSIINNNMMKVNKNNLLVKIDNATELTSDSLIENLLINGIEYKLLDNNDVEITENTKIGTNSTLNINDVNYNIILIGDATDDGAINSADLLKIVKYLKGKATLNDSQANAADVTRDNTINSADLLKYVKYLKGVTQFNY